MIGAPYSQRTPALMVRVEQHTPVIGGVSIVDRFAEIFVRVAKGEGTGVGDADEEVGEVGAAGGYAAGRALGRGAGKSENAARILLKEIVELLLAKIAAEGEVVMSRDKRRSTRKSRRCGHD